MLGQVHSVFLFIWTPQAKQSAFAAGGHLDVEDEEEKQEEQN